MTFISTQWPTLEEALPPKQVSDLADKGTVLMDMAHNAADSEAKALLQGLARTYIKRATRTALEIEQEAQRQRDRRAAFDAYYAVKNVTRAPAHSKGK